MSSLFVKCLMVVGLVICVFFFMALSDIMSVFGFRFGCH